jgi:hypothetical protein
MPQQFGAEFVDGVQKVAVNVGYHIKWDWISHSPRL